MVLNEKVLNHKTFPHYYRLYISYIVS